MACGTLYLCPTPIGNLEDITLRVLRTLREVYLIAAEDTRHTRKLLNHFDIHTRVSSYHEHNKNKKAQLLLETLLAGHDVALVSDAGTPGISDPGEELVREAVLQGICVVSLPGPNALITALVASGLPSSTFAFFGFIPHRGAKRRQALTEVVEEEKTVIFYEAPHRLVRTLGELSLTAGDRPVVVARELTKIHEQFVRGTLAEVLAHFTAQQPRGECTVILSALKNAAPREQLSAEQLVEELVSSGMQKKQAVREAAVRLGLSRRDVYRRVCIKE